MLKNFLSIVFQGCELVSVVGGPEPNHSDWPCCEHHHSPHPHTPLPHCYGAASLVGLTPLCRRPLSLPDLG